jgi:hypothetical protein
MQTGVARVLLTTLGVCCLAGCTQAEPAATPTPQHEAKNDAQIQREQRALERRRLHLQKQLLGELHKLRKSRQASTGPAEPAGDDAPEPTAEDKLLIFGGAHHEAFLGCLCEEHNSDSIFNMLGEYGADSSATSLRNKFAPYGSNYDDTSACNAAATHPPVVLAADGKSLGLLTVNTGLKRRITAPSVTDWLARVCGE